MGGSVTAPPLGICPHSCRQKRFANGRGSLADGHTQGHVGARTPDVARRSPRDRRGVVLDGTHAADGRARAAASGRLPPGQPPPTAHTRGVDHRAGSSARPFQSRTPAVLPPHRGSAAWPTGAREVVSESPHHPAPGATRSAALRHPTSRGSSLRPAGRTTRHPLYESGADGSRRRSYGGLRHLGVRARRRTPAGDGSTARPVRRPGCRSLPRTCSRDRDELTARARTRDARTRIRRRAGAVAG